MAYCRAGSPSHQHTFASPPPSPSQSLSPFFSRERHSERRSHSTSRSALSRCCTLCTWFRAKWVVPIASERLASPGALMGWCPKMTLGSSTGSLMALSLTATQGGEEGAPAAVPDKEAGPSAAATLADKAALAPPAVDVVTTSTASGARDLSPGTTLSVAAVTVSVGSTPSGAGIPSACAATSGTAWGPQPSTAPWAPTTLGAPPAPDPPEVGVPPGVGELDHKNSL
jgi:hypothetical protein